jgi:putative transposase
MFGGYIMTFKDEILDEILKNYSKPEDMFGPEGIVKSLSKAMIERVMKGEMTHHLGYEKSSPVGKNTGNSRNGNSKKTILTDQGKIEIETPRDRNGEFEPIIIPKGERRFTGFDEKIIAMYARGMSTRDIQSYLEEIYNYQVSPELISIVTEEVMKEVIEWQRRPLDPIYPIIYLDALRVNIRHENQVKSKSIYLALGVNIKGQKELLGMWIEETEGAKFWLRVITELQNRGVKDILIASVDGLKGFDEAILSVYPKTEIQLCIVHMVRNSVKYVSYKDLKAITSDLKKIYQAINADEAALELELFAEKWDNKYSMISKSWKANWAKIIPFFSYPDYIRKAIYTTNAIESLNRSLRKVIKTKAVFPNDESAIKLLYLALNNIAKKWTMPIREWGLAMNQFIIRFGERLQNL